MAVNAQAYFSANPDVAASYAENAYGMTPQQFADFHYENYGRNEQRSPTGSVSSQQILDFLTANPNLTDDQPLLYMTECLCLTVGLQNEEPFSTPNLELA